MCVAAIAWNAHPRWRLVVVPNRDEFHERPSAPLSRWQGEAGVIAGRDLRAGGTWLGVSEAGRFALVTNYRLPGYPRADRASRGGLVSGWLEQRELPELAAMNPFNLFVADTAGAAHVTNHPDAAHTALTPGVHGLSNGPLAPAWSKTRSLCHALSTWLDAGEDDHAPLFDALRREAPAPPPHWAEDEPEPRFAPVFIRDPAYGTRCSTVIAIAADGSGTIVERGFDGHGAPIGEARFAFSWPI